MKQLRSLALFLAVAVAAPAARPPLVLVSLDAFRWDYCSLHPEATPHLRALAAEGVTAQGLISVFPSNTFPNHYSIVTGLYPAHHGIINNEMFDAAAGQFFNYKLPGFSDSRWWRGEPIWVTAIKQGGNAASWFWVGSEAVIKGVRPMIWHPFDPKVPFESRLDEMLAWLEKAAGDKPTVALFYLEEVNSIGHKFGPDSPELVATLKQTDDRVGAIAQRLHDAHLGANLIVVSDHGMTPISRERIIYLDDYVDPNSVQVDFAGPVAGVRPHDPAALDAVMHSLAALPHAKAWRAADLPARFHLTPGPRVPPIWIVPELGWEVYTHAEVASYPHFNRGDHGFDPAFTAMHGIFIADGPSFRSHVTLPAVENVNIYNLLCAALGLNPAPNDGDDRLVRGVMR
ncbi:MAG TPA: ectonucleotide pyrophosphatase/phosphodiesterase [Opitutus sp.]|nr:ectonucleotide pyrophosphatase/phosphodiesterase [Opitutus sp.]